MNSLTVYCSWINITVIRGVMEDLFFNVAFCGRLEINRPLSSQRQWRLSAWSVSPPSLPSSGHGEMARSCLPCEPLWRLSLWRRSAQVQPGVSWRCSHPTGWSYHQGLPLCEDRGERKRERERERERIERREKEGKGKKERGGKKNKFAFYRAVWKCNLFPSARGFIFFLSQCSSHLGHRELAAWIGKGLSTALVYSSGRSLVGEIAV